LIAIMSDELHRGRVMLRIVFLFDDYKSRIADHVCVRKDPIAVDHKAGSNASRHCTGVPRYFVIRILRRRRNPNQTLSDINRLGSLRNRIRYDEKGYQS